MAQTPGHNSYTHLAAPRTVQVHAKLFYSAVGACGTGAARAKSSNTTTNPSHHDYWGTCGTSEGRPLLFRVLFAHTRLLFADHEAELGRCAQACGFFNY